MFPLYKQQNKAKIEMLDIKEGLKVVHSLILFKRFFVNTRSKLPFNYETVCWHRAGINLHRLCKLRIHTLLPTATESVSGQL